MEARERTQDEKVELRIRITYIILRIYYVCFKSIQNMSKEFMQYVNEE